MAMMLLLLSAALAAADTAAAPRPLAQQVPRFNHSWDTTPVFWFSANTTGPENPGMEALIAKYPVAILAWQMGTNQAPAFRHGEDKLHAQAAVRPNKTASWSLLASSRS
jgi:hypothetical protein